jgi:hypothetical protein
VRERMKTMSLEKGSLLFLVKWEFDCLSAGSISFGMISRKRLIVSESWHEFSSQVLCHVNDLLGKILQNIPLLPQRFRKKSMT